MIGYLKPITISIREPQRRSLKARPANGSRKGSCTNNGDGSPIHLFGFMEFLGAARQFSGKLTREKSSSGYI